MSSNHMPKHSEEQTTDMPFWKVMQNIAAASFGVQTRKHREEAFGSSSVMPFIAGGILFTVVFVGVLLLVVRSVLL